MNQIYMTQAEQYNASPMAFTNVPDLISCTYDDDTDPSPSPPVTYSNDLQYSTYDYSQHPHSTILSSVEFTDLTQIQQPSDRARWNDAPPSRRSTGSAASSTTSSSHPPISQDNSKEAASNMRIRRRAQNRASQRAFRERKEKHVQHLEHELELLESKHQHLARSYTDLDSNHASLKGEVVQLRQELASFRSSREGSVVKREGGSTPGFFDPFAGENYFGTGGELGF